MDIENLSIDDTLTARHKRERKELQAKIQSLKKSAGKGDKKKKKEILEEISKLELDLDQRHNVELSQSGDPKTDGDQTSQPDDSFAHECITGRVSKAQKRRDRKANDERLRQEEYKVQEELNKNGPRMMETRAIKKILNERKLTIYPILSDGDCLYNAVRHQLQETDRTPFDVVHLRKLTADYISDHKTSLIGYMTNPDTGDSLSDMEFEQYCNKLRTTSAWGGQIEIMALVNVLKCPIEVVQATGPSTIIDQTADGLQLDGPNLILTYHRLMYSLGEHYNSTEKATVNHNSESENE